MARRAGVVITFSEADLDRVRGWGANAVSADLVHHIPTPSEAERNEWHRRFSKRPVAVLAGQVRADKRPDVFVEACRRAEVTAAIIGPAMDGEELIADAVSRGEVIRVAGYLPLASFAAAVAEADVVVATHAVGSVSGPLSFAVELGVRSVAPNIGGLAETVTAPATVPTGGGSATAIAAGTVGGSAAVGDTVGAWIPVGAGIPVGTGVPVVAGTDGGAIKGAAPSTWWRISPAKS